MYTAKTRVIVTENYGDLIKGMVGTVCEVCFDGKQGIVFDNEFLGGHNLFGNCDEGHGYWVPPQNITAIDDGCLKLTADSSGISVNCGKVTVVLDKPQQSTPWF